MAVHVGREDFRVESVKPPGDPSVNPAAVKPGSPDIELGRESFEGSIVRPLDLMADNSPGKEPEVGSPEQWGKLTRSQVEEEFLRGPRGRLTELFSLLRIGWEFIKGFRALHFLGPCVTVFGSARTPEGHPYYELAREVGNQLAKRGFTVVTGGGPGVMEAANRGAKDAGGVSIGLNIKLPHEQHPNQFVDKFVEFDHFFLRKLMLRKYSYGFVVAPGGIGTVDEVFEVLTHIQTKKMKDFPVVLLDKQFWEPLLDFMKKRLVAAGTISPGDMDMFKVTDSPAEAADYILNASVQKFGLHAHPVPVPKRILLEKR